MEISLDILSDQEFDLYNTTIALQGTIEQKSEEFERLGIAAKYKELHQKYFEIKSSIEDFDVKIESLKRLAFLNWYVQVEPAIYTGMEDLNREVMFNSYCAINDLLRSNSLDKEFKWMLSFYSCWEWTILDFIDDKLKSLEVFVKNVDTTAKHVPSMKIRKDTMMKRGQMGIYFLDFSYTNS